MGNAQGYIYEIMEERQQQQMTGGGAASTPSFSTAGYNGDEEENILEKPRFKNRME